MFRDLHPIHPSEVLKEDFMQPFNLTVEQLAVDIHVSCEQLNSFLSQKQPLTADLALRLARYFSTDAQSWLNLQNHYDLEIVQSKLKIELENFVKPFSLKNKSPNFVM